MKSCQIWEKHEKHEKHADWQPCDLVVNGADFCPVTNLSGFDVKSNAWQMAAVCRIFILQQIKLEKNGFHYHVD